MEKICFETDVEFEVTTGAVAEEGNYYGCLGTQPNPNWFYFEVADGGDILLEASAMTDIDFIVWGPFETIDEARLNCGILGTDIESPIVDCSYSGASIETPEITGASSGDIYIMLITNYAGVTHTVTLTQIGGTGTLDCAEEEEDLPCLAAVGTYDFFKNGEALSTDFAIMCQNDEVAIVSNLDYVLPDDTIPYPLGDGIYTAQIMWLVYSDAPTFVNPEVDPNYLDLIISGENISIVYDDTNPVVNTFGTGVYYYVPVTGDDGEGDGGVFENNRLHWDLDENGCFELGDPFTVVYQDSPISFEEVETTCVDEFPFQINVTPEGGDFSGDVLDNGIFVPGIVGVGEQVIYYSVVAGTGCEFIDSIYIDVVECDGVSVNETNQKEIKVYPNPFSEFTTIDMGKLAVEKQKVVVYDMLGKVVYERVTTANEKLNIERNSLETGTYVLSIYNKDLDAIYSTQLVVE